VRHKGGFWREFFSGDNSKVNTMAVISIVLAAPVVLLSSAALIYHIFILKKGLDSPSVQLLIAMLTAATGGLGASLFSRSTFRSTLSNIVNPGPPPDWKPPPPKPMKGD
jgi:hypothetical protein